MKYKTKYKWRDREWHFLCLKYKQRLYMDMEHALTRTPFLDLVYNTKIRLTGGISSSLFGSDMSPGKRGAMDEESGTTSPENINNQIGS